MAKNSSPSRAPKTGAQLQTTWRNAKNASKPPKTPSHRHMTANRNNVQIFKCELRKESGTTNTMKICEILPEATQTGARGDCQILLVEIFQISKCELQGVRSPLFHVENKRNSFINLRGLSQHTGEEQRERNKTTRPWTDVC